MTHWLQQIFKHTWTLVRQHSFKSFITLIMNESERHCLVCQLHASNIFSSFYNRKSSTEPRGGVHGRCFFQMSLRMYSARFSRQSLLEIVLEDFYGSAARSTEFNFFRVMRQSDSTDFSENLPISLHAHLEILRSFIVTNIWWACPRPKAIAVLMNKSSI